MIIDGSIKKKANICEVGTILLPGKKRV